MRAPLLESAVLELFAFRSDLECCNSPKRPSRSEYATSYSLGKRASNKVLHGALGPRIMTQADFPLLIWSR